MMVNRMTGDTVIPARIKENENKKALSIGGAIGAMQLIPFIKDTIFDKGIIMNIIKSKILTKYDISAFYWGISGSTRQKYFGGEATKVFASWDTNAKKYTEVLNSRNGTFAKVLFNKKNVPFGVVIASDEIFSASSEEMTVQVFLPKIKKCEQDLHEYVNNIKMYDESLRQKEGELAVNLITSKNGNQFSTVPRRSMDTVYLPQEKKDKLIKSIRDFIDSEKYRKENGIPNHYGICLYGPPGTGKSTVINALASMFDGEMQIYQPEAIDRLTFIQGIKYRTYQFVLIEDIDSCDVLNENRASGTVSKLKTNSVGFETSSVSLSSVLNTMDGIISPSRVIYIFTTNHLDRLDPALIRPGRIDLCMEVDYVNDETFNQFLKHMFHRSLPADRTVIPELTFAQVQNDMFSKPKFENIIAKYTTEKELK